MTSFNTLADALDAAAETDGEIGFIDGANDERRLSYRLLKRAALRMLAVLQAEGAQPGDALLLYIPDNLRFLQFYWAAIYGGLTPVPVAAGATDAHLAKLAKVWAHMGEPRVVTDARHMERILGYFEHSNEAAAGERLAENALSDEPPAVEQAAERAAITPDQTAFIQFSSGSTGDPKGVVLTHANVLANIAAITEGSRFGAHEIALSWMPLTHDMGLIGFHLTLLTHAFNHHLMATDLFARRPMLWLDKAAEKNATLLCSPNFGYRHTLRAIGAKGLPDIDLSRVRLIYNGAEPIAAPLAREFLETLAPVGLSPNVMFCVYGLAEASLAATFPPAGAGLSTIRVARGELGIGDPVRFDDSDNAIELVDLGSPVAGADLRIADGDGQALGEDTVGRVWIKGPNVTAGYYANDDANAAAQVGDGWLDTGDLGFVHDGDLFIAGRAKDIIFINGANHYPQDLEAVAQAAEGVDLNKIAAAGVRAPGADADELVFFVVFRGHTEDFVPIARDVAHRVNQGTGLAVDHVVPVRQIPKTTSGKLQRAALARDYAAGAFDDVIAELAALMRPADAAPTATTNAGIADELKAICDEVAPDKKIGVDDDLFEIGLSSLELAQIHEGIEARWPDTIEINDLFDYPTINDLAAFLESETAA
ncbi:non-ribosomal peptide synthetase [Salinisphaera hydrothermalis]|uniref:AMP-dependent synthetase and ligase n=1 Tax=Salinisphaera hydrothermalis (strain C41B8) TaxID=1304275 RepID=A0A084IID8_SALHC|nr:non-ribosomal peptide synthetase [Salinisphaera hydrothermalis]KEZ76472.1 AMP-dependent synthetase and ligase [Salinisphaera hydrothermalis C41B8]